MTQGPERYDRPRDDVSLRVISRRRSMLNMLSAGRPRQSLGCSPVSCGACLHRSLVAEKANIPEELVSYEVACLAVRAATIHPRPDRWRRWNCGVTQTVFGQVMAGFLADVPRMLGEAEYADARCVAGKASPADGHPVALSCWRAVRGSRQVRSICEFGGANLLCVRCARLTEER